MQRSYGGTDLEANAKLKVLYVIEAMEGGSKRHVLQLLTHLDRSRFIPSLLCSTLRGPRAAEEVEGLRARGLGITVVQMRRGIHPIADLTAYRQILRHLHTHEYDIVHTHSANAGFLGRRAAYRAGVPVTVHTPHVLPFEWASGLERRLYLSLERMAATWSSSIVALTDTQKQIALEAELCHAKKLTVIGNGISTWQYDREEERVRKRKSLGIGPETVLIGTVARLVPQKGLEYFFHAAKGISESVPSSRFLVVGEGQLEKKLHRLTDELGISARCLWIPHQAKIEAIYCAMDVFVLPSLWEGLPYTLLEAMAAACPIVATDIQGNADVICDGETGLLAPPRDGNALAEKVVSLIENPDLAGALARNAVNVVRDQYSLDRFIQETQDLYETLMSQVR